MPKAASTRSKATSSRKDPISKPPKEEKKPTKSKQKPEPETSDNGSSPNDSKTEEKKNPRKDSGKNSHLYTDDNLSPTGLHAHATSVKCSLLNPPSPSQSLSLSHFLPSSSPSGTNLANAS